MRHVRPQKYDRLIEHLKKKKKASDLSVRPNRNRTINFQEMEN